MRKLFRFLFSLLKLGFVAVVAIVGFAIWQENCRRSPPVPPPSPPMPPAGGAYPPAAPQGLPAVDLLIVGARGTWKQDQRFFEVTLQNVGPGVASAVHGDCSYRCTSSGFNINNTPLVRNAYLVPGRPFNYPLPVTACADTGFQLSCIVYSGVRVQEANTVNNQWTGWVQF